MERPGYWQRRLTRRRVLATGAAGSGLLALTVIGCGGGGSGEDESAALSNVTQPKDTSKDAKKGGVYQVSVNGDETTLDALASSRGAGFGGPGLPAYSRILGEKESIGRPKTSEIIGDAAESWELSPDNLKLTVKLKPNVKFDPRPPTNGRVVDADDVVFSLNKFFAQSPYASQLSYERDPSSPVESISKIDARTVQYKLAFPWGPLIKTFAHGNHLIQPKEAESQFNPKTDPRGSGPWMLSEWQPSLNFKWRKNPNWYRTDIPYIEGYDQHIITEYAARLSQLRAKNIYHLEPTAPDTIDLVKTAPEMKLYQGDIDSGITSFAFGSRPGSPFYDIRLRRALSMSIDRELLAEVEAGADLYRQAGIPFPLELDSHIAASWAAGDYWLDPRDESKWGEAGKYWKYDPAEAKKLVEAAGHKTGIDVIHNQSNRAHGSPKQAEILAEMIAGSGIRLKINVVDYNTVFLPLMWVPGPVKGDYDGITVGNSGGWQAHVASSIYITQHIKGSYTASRRWDEGQDKIDKMIENSLKEFDENKLRTQIHDIQKELASYMSGVTYTYGQRPYTMVWPWVQNYGVWQNSRESTTMLNYWIDETKRTS